ncbi:MULTISPECIES: hypothetical protein [Flavobacterium]|uniref:hypothetical protein n=1 Tax=Flavobacterium TaxID=237 RepID=UPI0015ABBB03|nr:MULTISPECIES: hypothetical protein [Flavobacterium]
MDSIVSFIKNNKWSLLVALAVYLLYLQFIFSGNRICDCVATEKYGSSNGSRAHVGRFYHK